MQTTTGCCDRMAVYGKHGYRTRVRVTKHEVQAASKVMSYPFMDYTHTRYMRHNVTI